jgi:hypothetical protein
MNTSFQLVGIDAAPFQALFGLNDEELINYSAKRCFANEQPGYPCRISLQDAKVGEELLLLPYTHQSAKSPYHASGPIFIRKGAVQRRLEVNTVPRYVTDRLISFRAYDAKHMIVAASVREGVDAAAEINDFFKRPDVAYVHLHNAKRGCFSCEAVRA